MRVSDREVWYMGRRLYYDTRYKAGWRERSVETLGANQRRHKLGHKASIYKYILDAHVTRTIALSVRLESGRMAETIDCRMNQQLSSTTAAKKTSWDQLDGHFHSSYDLHHAVRGHDVDAPSEYHRDSRQKVSPYWHYPFALMR